MTDARQRLVGARGRSRGSAATRRRRSARGASRGAAAKALVARCLVRDADARSPVVNYAPAGIIRVMRTFSTFVQLLTVGFA